MDNDYIALCIDVHCHNVIQYDCMMHTRYSATSIIMSVLFHAATQEAKELIQEPDTSCKIQHTSYRLQKHSMKSDTSQQC